MDSIYRIDRPIFVPEGESDFPELLAESLKLVTQEALGEIAVFLETRTREGFLRLERALLRAFMVASSHVVGGVVTFLHQGVEWVADTVQRARESSPKRVRHQGRPDVAVRLLGGVQLAFATPYLGKDGRQRSGRRRGVGRRGVAGAGCYPVLEALGVIGRATPALASEVATQTVRTASFEEARQALHERGITLNKKTVRALALKVGGEAVAQRQARSVAAEAGQVFSNEFAGQRIVLSADGGRVRLREGGKRGRKGKHGYRCYRTPWREPKLVIAYVIDDKGRKAKNIAPLYDATLGDADAAFDILVTELKLRGAARAKQIIVTGDGALWIWNRVADLASRLGIDQDRLVEVADFYHAVEHLTAIANLCVSWTAPERVKWVRKMRRRLKRGNVSAVIADSRSLCRGRNAKKIATEVRYFENREERMRYDEFRKDKIPLGSGAVESAIRRVINLRLKGPSIFWRSPNAERMLHLRSYLKAGRWNELMLRVMYRTPYGAVQAAAAA